MNLLTIMILGECCGSPPTELRSRTDPREGAGPRTKSPLPTPLVLAKQQRAGGPHDRQALSAQVPSKGPTSHQSFYDLCLIGNPANKYRKFMSKIFVRQLHW